MEADIYRQVQELQEANEKLRASMEEQDRFFSVSIDMLCISGFDGHFKKVNPAFQETLGWTPEEFCKESYLSFIHPDDIQKTADEVKRQFDTHAHVLNFENRYRHKDGSYRLLSWKSAPVGDLMYAAARDITESRKNEDEVKIAKEAAEFANRELESFSYSVAHDLRAPLRSIVGFSNMILDDEENKLSNDSKDYLQRVMKAGQKMGDLIDGLLNLSRISRKRLEKNSVNLSQFANEICLEMQNSQPDRKVTFKIENDLTIDGDGLLLKQALVNLLNNAWKYSSKASTPVQIEFGKKEENGTRVYYVRDNGVGFDMKYGDKLFGVFQRLHSVQDFEGTGIGLATVQRIINSHGGKIWAEAAPNKGATFFFTLN